MVNLALKVHKYTESRMYDKSGQLGWLPRKSSMVNGILFKKEDDFCMTFELAIGRSACGLAVSKLNVYI